MSTESRDVLVRAAREMLRWDQERLAKKSGVGLITVRRFETGRTIGEATIKMLMDALRQSGVAFIGQTTIDGLMVREGVALEPRAKRLARPAKRKRRTKEQIAADDAVKRIGNTAAPGPAAKPKSAKGEGIA